LEELHERYAAKRPSGPRDEPQTSAGSGHDLYKTGDDAPDEIKDRNGEVVLGLCKRCGRAEIELSEYCISEPRFFIDHGMIHDRITGKHVVTDGEPPFEDSVEQVCRLLNSLTNEPQAARETLTDEQVYYAARKLALALPVMYENANHKGSLVPNTAALTVARMMLDAAIRLGAPLSGKPGEQPQAAQGGWEQAFLLSAEVADSMGRAAAHANVYGRLSEAYWAVETSIKQLLEQVKKGETVTNNNGLPVSFSIPQTVRQPIETAPKDGTHILAWRIPIGIRVTNNTHPPTVVHWFNDPEEPGFYTSVNELAPEHPYNPTHWMPIP
jgi:hypothetical protein